MDEVVASGPRARSLEDQVRRWESTLRARLRLVAERHEHPEVAAEVIEAPLVVLGMPRTGSTFLGGLLAQDPGHRCIGPREEAPFAGSGPGPYGAGLERPVDAGMLSRHLTDPPPEDVRLLGYEFLAHTPHSHYDIPRYLDRAMGSDATVAYEWHRRVLQHGQRHDRRDRWSLRSPAHSYHLAEVLATYPDALVVCTHRDPARSFVSAASFIAYLRQPNYERPIDRVALGRELAARWGRALERMLADRDAHARPEQFFDVRHEELLADPVGVVGAIYEHFGLAFPVATSRAVAEWAAAHQRESQRSEHGRHEYDASDYGIDLATLEADHEGYRRRFGVAAGV